ncbi:MAG: nucleotidyltransferase domain-containing protein [Bacteroidota bacterium]
MTNLFREHIEETHALFRKYKMRRVWLFGSALSQDEFKENSDIDLLYEPYKEQMTIREFLDFPLLLKKDIEELFERKVDLIRNLPFRNPYFQAEIDQTKTLIFDHAQRSEEISV